MSWKEFLFWNTVFGVIFYLWSMSKAKEQDVNVFQDTDYKDGQPWWFQILFFVIMVEFWFPVALNVARILITTRKR